MQHEATRLQIQSWIQIQMRMILIGGHQRTVQRTENRDERRENRGLRTSQRIENREKRKEKRDDWLEKYGRKRYSSHLDSLMDLQRTMEYFLTYS